jgi:hypothetical protein
VVARDQQIVRQAQLVVGRAPDPQVVGGAGWFGLGLREREVLVDAQRCCSAVRFFWRLRSGVQKMTLMLEQVLQVV